MVVCGVSFQDFLYRVAGGAGGQRPPAFLEHATAGLSAACRVGARRSKHSLRRLPWALRQRLEVHRVRGAILEGLVRPEVVVAVEERSQLCARVRQRRVGLQVDLFVLDRAPQPLDEHVGVSRRLRRLATIRADVSG